jgi:hypothetical protein
VCSQFHQGLHVHRYQVSSYGAGKSAESSFETCRFHVASHPDTIYR